MSTMFEEMAKTPAAWLSNAGSESLVVLSTRVRLARNIAGCQFPESADSDTKKRVIGYIDSVLTRSQLFSEGEYIKATDIDSLDKDFLIERHLISPVFLNNTDMNKALFIDKEERVSICLWRGASSVSSAIIKYITGIVEFRAQTLAHLR